MGDIKVFRIDGDAVSELPGQSMAVERSAQTLDEQGFATPIGARILAVALSTALSEQSLAARGGFHAFASTSEQEGHTAGDRRR